MLATASAQQARAEPVEIKLAGGSRGQGWLFRDPDTGICGVVTAAHVIAGMRQRDILVVGRRGAEAYASAVRVLSPPLVRDSDDVVIGGGVDAALILVEGPLQQQGCSGSITGSTNMTSMLGRTTVAELDRFDAGETPTQPVQFTVKGSTEAGLLALKTQHGDPPVVPGYSGAAIVDAPAARTGAAAAATPLAMVIQTATSSQEGQFVAVRFDAIWTLVRSALGEVRRAGPVESRPGAGFTISNWSGVTLDPKCPPANLLLLAPECAWRTRPLPGSHSIEFEVRSTSGPAPIAEVVVDVEGYLPKPGRTADFDVNPTGRPEDWSFIRRCEVAPAVIKCHFSQVNSQIFKIILDALDDQPLTVKIRSITP